MKLGQMPGKWSARLAVALLVVAPAGCATWDGEIEAAPGLAAEQPIYPGLPPKLVSARAGEAPGRSPNLLTRVRYEGPPADQTRPTANPALPMRPAPTSEFVPIDLPTTLRLAGANNLQIRLANERLRQAEARLDGANALWLPSVNVGAGYSHHAGRIQDTMGQILDVERNSLFVGGGPL